MARRIGRSGRALQSQPCRELFKSQPRRERAGVTPVMDWTLVSPPMPSQQLTASSSVLPSAPRRSPSRSCGRAASSWRSMRRPMPSLSPFLIVRFGMTILILALIVVASGAPWPATAREAGHSMMAGVLLHGGYLSGVWWAVAQGSARRNCGLVQRRAAAAHRAARRSPARRARHSAAMGGHRRRVHRHPAGPGSTARRRRHGRARRGRLPMIVNFAAIVSVTFGTFYQKRFVASADLRTGTCLQFVGALAVVTPLALMTETLRFDVTPTLLAALAWSVLVISIAAIALLLLMIRHGEVSRIAALIYLVPPITALQAYFLLRRAPEQRSNHRDGHRRHGGLAGDAARVAANSSCRHARVTAGSPCRAHWSQTRLEKTGRMSLFALLLCSARVGLSEGTRCAGRANAGTQRARLSGHRRRQPMLDQADAARPG